MSLMSQTQYAKHLGVNASYISHLKAKGFLTAALNAIPGKKYPLIDSAKADKLLSENLDRTFTRGSGVTTKDIGKLLTGKTGAGKETFQAARTESERFRAKQLKQKFEAKQEKWVLKSQVRAEALKAGQIFRDTFAPIPARIAGMITAESDEHLIGRIIIEEIERALRECVRKIKSIPRNKFQGCKKK